MAAHPRRWVPVPQLWESEALISVKEEHGPLVRRYEIESAKPRPAHLPRETVPVLWEHTEEDGAGATPRRGKPLRMPKYLRSKSPSPRSYRQHNKASAL